MGNLLEEARADSFLEPLEGAWPCWHLDFRLLAFRRWAGKFLLSYTSRFVVACHGPQGRPCASPAGPPSPFPHLVSGWGRKKMSLADPPRNSPEQSQRQDVLKDHLFQENYLHPCPWQPWRKALAPGGCAPFLKQDLKECGLCSKS